MSTPLGSRAAAPAAGLIMTVAILASFVAFLDGSVVNLALPAISGDLGGGLATQQWVVDAYLLTLGALILVAGAISDVFGRLPVLRAGLIVFGLASIACTIAPDASVLIVARGIQGVGAALLVPSSLALINSSFGPDEQPKAIGTWTAWTGTAFVIGPLLGGILVDTLNWRWIFAVNIIPVALTVVLARRLTEPQRSSSRSQIDVPGAVLAAVGLTGTVYALIEQQRLGWSEPIVAAALAVGLMSLSGLLWRESHTDHPMIPLPMFAIRNFGVGNLATTFIYAGVSMGMLIIALFLQEVAGFSALWAGLATLPVPVLSFVIARPIGNLSGRYGPRLFMATGPIIAGCGYLLMLTVSDDFDFWSQMFPGLVLFGIGLSVTVTPLTSAILSAVGRAQSGIGSAINNAISRVSGLVAVACTGIIVGGQLDYAGFRRVALVTAVLFIAGGLISAIGIRNRDHRPDQIPPQAAAACSDRATGPPAPDDVAFWRTKCQVSTAKRPHHRGRCGSMTPMAELLNESDITAALADLPTWARDGDALTRTVECPDFPAAIAFVGRVAEAAEAANHHPDIDIRWRTVTFTLSSHSDGGITGKDTSLAHQIDDLAP